MAAAVLHKLKVQLNFNPHKVWWGLVQVVRVRTLPSPIWEDLVFPPITPQEYLTQLAQDRKSTRLNSSHTDISRMLSSA